MSDLLLAVVLTFLVFLGKSVSSVEVSSSFLFYLSQRAISDLFSKNSTLRKT